MLNNIVFDEEHNEIDLADFLNSRVSDTWENNWFIYNDKDEAFSEEMILFALFICAEYVNDDPINYTQGYYMHDDYPYNIKDYEFRDSWDWLINVIKKIDTLDTVDSSIAMANIRDNFPNFKDVYNTTLEFIKLFNQQNTNEINDIEL